MDRGAWQAIVHRVAKTRTWLSLHTLFFFIKLTVSLRTQGKPVHSFSGKSGEMVMLLKTQTGSNRVEHEKTSQSDMFSCK